MAKRQSASVHPRQRCLLSGLTVARIRGSVSALAIWLVANAALAADPLDRPVSVDIQPQALSKALLQFGQQARLQIMLASNVAANQTTGGIKGTYPAGEALSHLLRGSGLSYQAHDNTVTVSPAKLVSTARAEGQSASSSQSSSDSTTTADSTKKNELADNNEVFQRRGLEEVVVTAQKREERLQDVPVPVTVVSADALISSNQLRIQDYASRIPGLDVVTNEYGAPQIAIRGITTGGFTNPTVGIVIDDVPYGASSVLAYGQEVPYVDPSDLARVEVLRGPQGTLYGASSIGGLIKYVTIDPSTEKVSGEVQAGASGVVNGAEAGFNLRGSVNVPLSDTVALRASAFTRRDPGYIDNVLTGERGVNRGDADGARLSALWQPSESLSLKLSALTQRTKTYGSSDVDVEPGVGDLQQSNVRGVGGYDRTVQAYSATLTTKIGDAELKSVSGYGRNSSHDSLDYTPSFGALTEKQFGVEGSPIFDHLNTSKFTEEVRLSMPVGPRLDWLLGVFYDHERSRGIEDILAAVPSTGEIVGSWVNINFPSTFEEIAGFTDFTFHITDQFDIQLGGRESRNRQTYMQTFVGPYTTLLGKPSPYVDPEVGTGDNSFTYLVTPEYKISPNLMIYARLASGYRPGGPNFGLKPHYGPDTTKNYEIGLKGDVFDRVLSFDASVYYIQWNNIQVEFYDPSVASDFFVNEGNAKSQGAEFSVQSIPLPGLSIGAWVAFNDAVLTQNFPTTSTTYGQSGDRLPYGSRFSGNFSVQQDVPFGSVTAFAGGAVSYIGEREGNFTATPQRQIFPGYAKVDVRAGARYDLWEVDVFVNNLTDRRGILNGGLGTFVPVAFDYIQPRTCGLSVTRRF